MRAPAVIGTLALLIALPAVSLAHTFVAPSTVRADPDGSFSYRVVFVASEPITIAFFGASGVNVNPPWWHADCFCDEIYCGMSPGDSLPYEAWGTLNDPEQPGQMSHFVNLCPYGEVMSDITTVLPASNAGVGDPPLAALQLWNHPNPLVERTTFHFTLPRAGHVTLRLYDLVGRLRATLLDERREAGAGALVWSVAGARLTPGVYVARIESDGVARSRRIVITG